MLNNPIFVAQVNRHELITKLRTDLQDDLVRLIVGAQDRYITHPITMAVFVKNLSLVV
jgi:hypothetical protein